MGRRGAGRRECALWPFKCGSRSSQFIPARWIIPCRGNRPAPFIKSISTGSLSFFQTFLFFFLMTKLVFQFNPVLGTLWIWGYVPIKTDERKKKKKRFSCQRTLGFASRENCLRAGGIGQRERAFIGRCVFLGWPPCTVSPAFCVSKPLKCTLQLSCFAFPDLEFAAPACFRPE